MEKPVSYKGTDPYIFISYAHRDYEVVWPIITRLQQDGFRVWYDNGIPPVVEWDQDIAQRIGGCGFFLAFLSEHYLNSENCKDEIQYARDHAPIRCLVYLSPVTLPEGMDMRLSRLQAVMWYSYPTLDQAFEKLYEADCIQAFRDEVADPAVEQSFDPTEELYRKGLDALGQNQPDSAFQYFCAAAQRGHADAQFETGKCLFSGLGCRQDRSLATEWYRKAGEQGHAEAQFYFGCCCQNGTGVAQDDALAVAWFTKAANLDFPDAQCALACCYERGLGVTKDPEDAVYWYKRAAILGNPHAQYRMGHGKEFGFGTRRCFKDAVAWYEAAARQGHVDAQYTMGRIFKEGLPGIQSDPAVAASWFALAAEQGDQLAQYQMGKCCLFGLGIPKDISRAKALFLQAAQGNSSMLCRFQARCMRLLLGLFSSPE